MAENPEQAGTPRTRDVTRSYEDERIRVLWDATRCIHTGICLRELPGVFDVKARPWIDLSNGGAEQIAATVRACPTNALRYEAIGDNVPPEAPDEPTTIDVRPNGPLFVRGRVRLDVSRRRAARGRVPRRAVSVRREREQAVLRQQPPPHRVPRLAAALP